MLDTPNRDRQTERREATRREILAAAWEVAHESGLSQLTLREVAHRVGMRAPSLYSHFASKHAIYDAMFGEAWSDYEQTALATIAQLPEHPRSAIKQIARGFFGYAVADLARHQLMSQRTIPGFEPSPESYAPAVRVLAMTRSELAARGVDRGEDFDIWLALIAGLVDQQLANDPAGTRIAALLDRAIDMWADAIGLPPEQPRRARKPGTRR